MLEQQLIDVRDRFFRSVHRERLLSQAKADQLKADYSAYFEQFESILSSPTSNRKWLTGPNLSYVDFLAAEYWSWYRELVQEDCFSSYPHLAEYMKQYEELPTLREYHNSERFRNAHCLSPYAILGHRGGGNLHPKTGENLFWNAK